MICQTMLYIQKETVGVRDVAQQIKVLATKPDSMGSISGTHMVRRENSPESAFCASVCAMAPVPAE